MFIRFILKLHLVVINKVHFKMDADITTNAYFSRSH